jgi:hypothetical protein
MPKVAGRVIATKIIDGAMLAKIQMNGKLPKQGENVIVKWGAQRSVAQNALLWVYYTWLIDHGGLKEWGFFTPEALHSSLKAHFLSEKILSRGQWKSIEEGSTTILNKMEFSEYIEKIDNFVVEFFSVDTSVFWQEHKEYKSGAISMELTDEGKAAQARGEF